MMGEYIRRWAAEGAHAGEIQGPFSLEGITAWECDLSGCAPLEPASVQPAHVEALFCRAGQLRATLCKGQTVCAGPGELLLVSDAAELRRFSLEDGCFQGIFALMDKAASRDLPAQERTLWAGDASPMDQVAGLLRSHNGCMAVREPVWGPSVLASLCQLPKERRGAYFLLKRWELLYLLCNRQPAAVAPCANGYYDHYQADAVRNVHDYMLAHFDQHMTVPELARRFQLSPTFLKSCFRRLYGAPVHTYLQQYRLQTAARLLRTTSDSVLHIAVAVGYTGTSQFDSAFKALYHMTPAQYRKWCRENNVQNR